MIKIDFKPLSTNQAWKGRRFKSQAYKNYIHAMALLLPNIELPEPPYKLILDLWIDSRADADNCIKQFQDCLQKKYNFKDNLVYKLVVTKYPTSKNDEKCLAFNILHYDENNPKHHW